MACFFFFYKVDCCLGRHAKRKRHCSVKVGDCKISCAYYVHTYQNVNVTQLEHRYRKFNENHVVGQVYVDQMAAGDE